MILNIINKFSFEKKDTIQILHIKFQNKYSIQIVTLVCNLLDWIKCLFIGLDYFPYEWFRNTLHYMVWKYNSKVWNR